MSTTAKCVLEGEVKGVITFKAVSAGLEWRLARIICGLVN